MDEKIGPLEPFPLSSFISRLRQPLLTLERKQEKLKRRKGKMSLREDRRKIVQKPIGWGRQEENTDKWKSNARRWSSQFRDGKAFEINVNWRLNRPVFHNFLFFFLFISFFPLIWRSSEIIRTFKRVAERPSRNYEEKPVAWRKSINMFGPSVHIGFTRWWNARKKKKKRKAKRAPRIKWRATLRRENPSW